MMHKRPELLDPNETRGPQSVEEGVRTLIAEQEYLPQRRRKQYAAGTVTGTVADATQDIFPKIIMREQSRHDRLSLEPLLYVYGVYFTASKPVVVLFQAEIVYRREKQERTGLWAWGKARTTRQVSAAADERAE
jgi:hypothetical protein